MAKWNVGPKNGMWNGGRTVTKAGYVLIRVGVNHHLADCRGYAYEHQLKAEKRIGRRLRKGERATRSGSVIRRPRNRIVKCACGCGAKFRHRDASQRPRSFVTGHNMLCGRGRWG